MPLDFHYDLERYFNIQTEVTRTHIIPFIKEVNSQPINKSTVLEVGCGEAGVLQAFVDQGAYGVGVELTEFRANWAKKALKTYIDSNKLKIIQENIYSPRFHKEFENYFDIIILKDVIEHIPDQQKIIKVLSSFLKKDGCIFFGFPPWQMPFGGHQQISTNRFLKKIPYFHLLPSWLYEKILIWGREDYRIVQELMEIKETGISIEKFEYFVKKANLRIASSIFFLINPIYKWKFNIKARRQLSLINQIPYLRNFITTGVYYIVKK